MAKKKTNYHTMTNGELAKELAEKREALRAVRFSSAGSRPKDSSEPRKLRREIARILTKFSARRLSSPKPFSAEGAATS